MARYDQRRIREQSRERRDVIADGVLFGMLEAHGRSKPSARPWGRKVTTSRGRNIAAELARIAQQPGAGRLAPIPFASPDGPLVGTSLDVGAEIARQRAAIVAASRVH